MHNGVLSYQAGAIPETATPASSLFGRVPIERVCARCAAMIIVVMAATVARLFGDLRVLT